MRLQEVLREGPRFRLQDVLQDSEVPVRPRLSDDVKESMDIFEEEDKLVYERMITLAAKAKERGINVAFAFLPKSDVSDDERYGAIVTNVDNPDLLNSLTYPFNSAASGMVGRDSGDCE